LAARVGSLAQPLRRIQIARSGLSRAHRQARRL